MASQAVQAKANALNAKMEGAAASVIDEIDKFYVRKVARSSFACAVQCYDKAGTTGSSESLEMCARNCQIPYQQAGALVQNVSFIKEKGMKRQGNENYCLSSKKNFICSFCLLSLEWLPFFLSFFLYSFYRKLDNSKIV